MEGTKYLKVNGYTWRGEATLSFSFLQPLPVKVNFFRNEFDQSEQILFP